MLRESVNEANRAAHCAMSILPAMAVPGMERSVKETQSATESEDELL